MRTSWLAASFLLLPTVATAQQAAPSPEDAPPPTLGWMGAATASRPGTVMQVIPPVPGADVAYNGTTTIIYMNRSGATLVPGNNDSRTNRSTVVGQTSTIPPFEGSATEWNQIMSCVREIFSPFDVVITDQDPGNVPHMESLMGGRAQQAGMPQGVLGVSPFTANCSVIPNSIVFTFTQSTRDAYGSGPALAEELCEIAAQEIAHSFGLDHEYLASDPMTYLNYNGLKRFQNVDAQCGEYAPRTCGLPDTGVVCSQRQNSVAMLNARIGVGDAIAPSVAITSPANGATVPASFTVRADASDNLGVQKVELYVDGALVGTSTAAPFTFEVSGLATGGRTLVARAYDSKNTTDATVAVTVQAGAPQPQDPQDPQDPSNPDRDGDGRGDIITGGCAAAGGAAGPGALALLALVGVRRRRRA